MSRIESSVLSAIVSYTIVNRLALAQIHTNFNSEAVLDQRQLRGNITQGGGAILSHQYFLQAFRGSRYTFMKKIFDTLKRIYQESGARFGAIHMAGDEVPQQSWEQSPVGIAFGNESS